MLVFAALDGGFFVSDFFQRLTPRGRAAVIAAASSRCAPGDKQIASCSSPTEAGKKTLGYCPFEGSL